MRPLDATIADMKTLRDSLKELIAEAKRLRATSAGDEQGRLGATIRFAHDVAVELERLDKKTTEELEREGVRATMLTHENKKLSKRLRELELKDDESLCISCGNYLW